MKYNIIFLVALMIIVAITVDRIEDAISDYDFKAATETFMQKGGRNTSDMGLKLCERVNGLEARIGIEATNCAEIYETQ